MLVRHLRGLDPSTLARSVYEEQKTNNWPGLVKETRDICKRIDVNDCNEDDIWKLGTKEYRKYLVKKCKEKDEIELRKMAETKSKCITIIADNYGKKSYMSENVLSKVRQVFRTRTKMHLFAGNYAKDYRFKKTNWLCRCGKSESETHILEEKCPIYEHLRLKHPNLDDDKQRTDYFTAVLELRSQLEDKDRRTQDTLVAGLATDSC